MSKLFSGDFTRLIFELTRLILGFGPLHPPGHCRAQPLPAGARAPASGRRWNSAGHSQTG